MINTINRKLDEANEQIQILETTKDALEFKLKSSESSDNKLKATIQNLENNLTELANEKNAIEAELGKEILDLKNNKKQMERSFSEIKETLAKEYADNNEIYEKKIFELELFIKSSQERNEENILALNNEKKILSNKFESKIDSLENKIEEQQTRIEDLGNEMRSLQKLLEIKENLYKNAQADFEVLESKYSKLLDLQKNAEEEIEKNKELINNYKNNDIISENIIKEFTLRISDYESQIEESKKNISSMFSSIEDLEKQKEKLTAKLTSSQDFVCKLQEDNKILLNDNTSLNEINRNLSGKSLLASGDSDFDRDSEIYLEEHEKKELSIGNFIVCRVIRYENKIWCLVQAKNQKPEYNWYEKYILQEVNQDIQYPKPIEEELEEKVSMLTEENKELALIRNLEFPEEYKSDTLVKIIENLLNYYITKKAGTAQPIKVTSFHIENIPISSIESAESIPDHISDLSVQVTAEEANQIFKKMKVLEEENTELENRIMLINQQLSYFKSEGKTNNFGNKSDATMEQIKNIILSLFEKLPLQTNELESNIKILLDIMGMNKDSQERLMNARKGKNSPVKQSGFKKLFSKKS